MQKVAKVVLVLGIVAVCVYGLFWAITDTVEILTTESPNLAEIKRLEAKVTKLQKEKSALVTKLWMQKSNYRIMIFEVYGKIRPALTEMKVIGYEKQIADQFSRRHKMPYVSEVKAKADSDKIINQAARETVEYLMKYFCQSEKLKLLKDSHHKITISHFKKQLRCGISI